MEVLENAAVSHAAVIQQITHIRLVMFHSPSMKAVCAFNNLAFVGGRAGRYSDGLELKWKCQHCSCEASLKVVTQPGSESLGLFLTALIHSRSIRIHLWLLLSGELAPPPWQSRKSLQPVCQNTTNQLKAEKRIRCYLCWNPVPPCMRPCIPQLYTVHTVLDIKLVEPS